MEQADLDLIAKHAKDNNELDRLYKEHIRLLGDTYIHDIGLKCKCWKGAEPVKKAERYKCGTCGLPYIYYQSTCTCGHAVMTESEYESFVSGGDQ